MCPSGESGPSIAVTPAETRSGAHVAGFTERMIIVPASAAQATASTATDRSAPQ
jgi:hypothetical protein